MIGIHICMHVHQHDAYQTPHNRVMNLREIHVEECA